MHLLFLLACGAAPDDAAALDDTAADADTDVDADTDADVDADTDADTDTANPEWYDEDARRALLGGALAAMPPVYEQALAELDRYTADSCPSSVSRGDTRVLVGGGCTSEAGDVWTGEVVYDPATGTMTFDAWQIRTEDGATRTREGTISLDAATGAMTTASFADIPANAVFPIYPMTWVDWTVDYAAYLAWRDNTATTYTSAGTLVFPTDTFAVTTTVEHAGHCSTAPDGGEAHLVGTIGTLDFAFSGCDGLTWTEGALTGSMAF